MTFPSYLWICCLCLPLEFTLHMSRASATSPALPFNSLHRGRRNLATLKPCTRSYVDPFVCNHGNGDSAERVSHVEKVTELGPEPRTISHINRTICPLLGSCFLSSFRGGVYQGEPARARSNSVKHTYKTRERTRYKILSPLIHRFFLKK